jgi:lysozyme family protein
MDADYNDALAFVLRWEGGFVDDPNDHGGRTMKGVTQKVYDAWRVSQGKAAGADVKGISDAEVNAIYMNNYWKTAFCSPLLAHLDFVQFDTAVNMGPVRAVKMLQQAVGVGVDGRFGPQTQNACDACNPPDTVAQYCAIREALYRQFAQAPGQGRFLAGWLNRLNALRAAAGVPGYAKRGGNEVDFGDTDHIERVPDISPNDPLDEWSSAGK